MKIETFSNLDVIEAACQARNFKTLLAAVDAAGLKETLINSTGITLLAPTDQAFEDVPKDILENLLKPENKDKLIQVLKMHILSNTMSLEDIMENDELENFEGKKLSVIRSDNDLYIGDARVTTSNIYVKNGIIHVVDTVIMFD